MYNLSYNLVPEENLCFNTVLGILIINNSGNYKFISFIPRIFIIIIADKREFSTEEEGFPPLKRKKPTK